MSNETLKVILNRRSIRKYNKEQISEWELGEILKAAIYAPSARNQQEWHFSVIQNEDLLGKIKDLLKEYMINSGVPFMVERASAPGFVGFYDAPTVIIVSAKNDAFQRLIDCGIAAENIALAAEAVGVGSCILTSSQLLFDHEVNGGLSKELGIPEGYSHVCTVTLGYKDGELPRAAPRSEGLVTIIK